MVSEESRGLLIRSVLAVTLASLISIRALRRKSLDRSGAVTGFFVVAFHIAADYRFGALILAFFFTSSYVTKIGTELKRKVEADFKEGGQRNWKQVLANSAIATVLILTVRIVTNWEDLRCLSSKEAQIGTGLLGGIIGHYACCNGDTWSSELGILSRQQPRLITTFKKVERGTNGGVTFLGLAAAAGGGGIIGLAYVIVGFVTAECSWNELLRQILVVPVALTAGLVGSLIDSLLGATVQFSGFCSVRRKSYVSIISWVVGKPGRTVRRISGTDILDNDAVNVVSVLLTTILSAMAALYIF